MLLDPAAAGLSPSIPEYFSQGKFFDGAEVKQRPCIEESGQSLENVNQTHLIQASGKLVL